MTCDEFEALALSGDGPALAHVEGCARCRGEVEKAKRALELTALPPLTAADRGQLAGLAASTLTAWRGTERRRGLFCRVAGLAVAAALGGLVASAVVLRYAGLGPAPAAGESWPLESDVAPEDDELDLAAYEVPWTFESQTVEGEAP
ncbi:MAG: hypothetical protein ACYC8T_37210 [Myxococcaceae bacterium]